MRAEAEIEDGDLVIMCDAWTQDKSGQTYSGNEMIAKNTEADEKYTISYTC